MNANNHEPSIVVRGLTKTWPGGVQAVRAIDFTVQPGEVFGLLGPNGAGKSTTVGMLTTTVAPSAGTARLAGYDVASDPISARSVSGVVFQDAVVDRALSGRRNLETHARLWGVSRPTMDRRIGQLVEAFGLRDFVDRAVGSYSGGQRRRLEIARTLLSEPAVLFLDEPTVGLDPRVRFELLDLISGLGDRTSMTVLLTTHYLDEAERLCDRVAIMHQGAIVALDTPAMLLASLGEKILELRVDGSPSDALAALRRTDLAIDEAYVVGSTISVPLHGRSADDVGAVLARASLSTAALSTRPPTLDDVYLRLTGDQVAA